MSGRIFDAAFLELEAYPMVEEPSGDSRLVESEREDADFYDVVLKYVSVNGAHEILIQHDNLGLDQATEIVEAIESQYNIEAEWIRP